IIPIGFGIGGDPVKAGLVHSFSRPGGNVTGVTLLTSLMEPKRLGLPAADDAAPQRRGQYPLCARRRRRAARAAHCPRPRTQRARWSYRARAPASAQALRRRATAACPPPPAPPRAPHP